MKGTFTMLALILATSSLQISRTILNGNYNSEEGTLAITEFKIQDDQYGIFAQVADVVFLVDQGQQRISNSNGVIDEYKFDFVSQDKQGFATLVQDKKSQSEAKLELDGSKMNINIEIFQGNAIVFDQKLPQFKMTCDDSNENVAVINLEPFYSNHVPGSKRYTAQTLGFSLQYQQGTYELNDYEISVHDNKNQQGLQFSQAFNPGQKYGVFNKMIVEVIDENKPTDITSEFDFSMFDLNHDEQNFTSLTSNTILKITKRSDKSFVLRMNANQDLPHETDSLEFVPITAYDSESKILTVQFKLTDVVKELII